jgi:TPP-dependent pyruvate/acetoin dehydrogenase alpha subunit
VGTTIANAVGYAYAIKVMRKRLIVMSFFGDGATEEGVFAESLNFAALKRLPIIFVCENNGYAIHTHQKLRQGLPDICAKARAAGVPAELIERNDLLLMHERACRAVNALRDGVVEGPIFFECQTYRWKEHVGPNEDYQLGYRTREEARPWIEHDQLPRLAALIASLTRLEIESQVESEIRQAIEFAEESPFPAADELLTDVFYDPSQAPRRLAALKAA